MTRTAIKMTSYSYNDEDHEDGNDDDIEEDEEEKNEESNTQKRRVHEGYEDDEVR